MSMAIKTSSILPLRLDGVGYVAAGVTALDRIDLTIARSRRLIVIGPNGSGKTSLLKICHGLIQPTRGAIAWNVTAESARWRHAFVAQKPLMLRRSARDNLIHALALAGYGHDDRRRRADEALERFGLSYLADRYATRLSGGEQQRLAIARAAARDSELLLLDEPTASLDPAATRAIEVMILRLSEQGVTIVMTTHDLGQARRMAEDAVLMHKGRVIESGDAQSFFQAPQRPETRAFLDGELIL